MGKGLWIGLALCAFVATAIAGVAQVRKQVEMSMLVSGTIDIDQAGVVVAHSLEQPDKLPPAVVELLGKAVPQWRFEPVKVDGNSVNARARMGVRVIAKQQDDGDYRLRVGSASFGDENGMEGETITADGKPAPPSYPAEAYMAGVQGTVYLVLKVDRRGMVEDAVEEQTNLTVLGSERQMKQARDVLARAAKAAARKWRYNTPTRGEQADDMFWSVRVPVAFTLCNNPRECEQANSEADGAWQAYIPGPKNSVPWISEEDNQQSADALIAGRVYPDGAGPKLLTALGEDAG